MDDRDALIRRAEILGTLADQLARQLEVERRANDELRAVLVEAPPAPARPDDAAMALALSTALGGMLLTIGMSVLLVGAAQPAPSVTVQSPVSAAAFPARASRPVQISMRVLPTAPPPLFLTSLVPVESLVPLPVKSPVRAQIRDCFPITTPERGRCYLEATGGLASGERAMRHLIQAYEVVGERTRVRALAAQYQQHFPGSAFAQRARFLAE